MTNLVDIYNAVAAQTITLTDGTEINAWRLDEVKNRAVSDQLPIRILLPPGAEGGSAVESWEMVSFKNAQVVWRVTELMLYQTVARGGGIKNFWETLTDYIARYVATFTASRKLTTRSTVTGFQPQAAVLEWPRASGNQFHGVQMTMLVSETIC